MAPDCSGAFAAKEMIVIDALDAHFFDDGSNDWLNGGVCMGEAIAFGTEAEDDADDGCAPDTDMQSGAWVSAGWTFD